MKCLVVLMVIGVAWAMPAAEQDSDPNILGSVLGVVKECVDGDVTLCLKEKALRYVETLRSKREITLVDGVTLDSKGSPRSARALEPLPEEPKAREAQVESRLVDGVADFLENYVVQFKLPSSAVEGMRRSLDEARGKKKKIKQLLPLLAIAKLKIMALIPLFLGIIAFAAAKAVVLAKISLLVAGIIALKKLLASKHTETSYEVVAHPHHEEHYASSGHGWGRSIDDAQNMAYSAHIKSD
ncbi:osiris 9 precursor [Bombyx mori]|nr:osiris 9 precursor [Bombyx mori]ACI23620.1 osiris 9 [Bombyx mori]